MFNDALNKQFEQPKMDFVKIDFFWFGKRLYINVNDFYITRFTLN